MTQSRAAIPGSRMSDIFHFARSYPFPMNRNSSADGAQASSSGLWGGGRGGGESTIMSNGLGITAVAATTLLATIVVHGGDYSAIAQADQSAQSVQGSA